MLSEVVNVKIEMESNITEAIEFFSQEIWNNFLNPDLDIRLENLEDVKLWIPKCEERVRAALDVLKSVFPVSCIALLVETLKELQIFVIGTIFDQSFEDIKDLIYKEDWKPVGDGIHTSLPNMFEDIVLKVCTTLEPLSTSPASEHLASEADVEGQVCVALVHTD